MNIFYLSHDPIGAAEMHCDKHVIKMITESAQIVSTVLRLRDFDSEILYRPTHQHHPCVVWAGKSRHNFRWLLMLLDGLIGEYDYRFGKPDKFLRARDILTTGYLNVDILPIAPWTPPALAMPDSYKTSDTVSSYRAYYVGEKSRMLRYTRREPPQFVGG